MPNKKNKKQTPELNQLGLDAGPLSLKDLTLASGSLNDGLPTTLAGATAGSLQDDPTVPDIFRAIDYEGSTTEDASAQEVAALDSAFQKRARQDHDRFVTTTDSRYHCTICFDSRDQLLAFLKRLGWDTLVDSDDILDGVALAEQLGVHLPPTPEALKFVTQKADTALSSLSLHL